MFPCIICDSPPFMNTINFSNFGSAEIPTFCCIPNIKVKDATGNIKYQVQMPSCCMGLCVNCMAEGCCNCKIPFYVYAPGVSPTNGNQVGKIVKLGAVTGRSAGVTVKFFSGPESKSWEGNTVNIVHSA